MKGLFLIVMTALILSGNGSLRAEGESERGQVVSKETIDLVLQLAKEKTIVADIETQNQGLVDDGKVQELRKQWAVSSSASDLVKTFQAKASSLTMRDYFSKAFSLIDCYSLDAQGRIVGTIYKPRDFLQDAEPLFVNCINQGQGKIFVDQFLNGPLGAEEPVEIAMPVTDGTKTVGVLVATVLAEK